jgi:hypothetical protein
MFTFLLNAGISAAVFETEVGRFALLDRWERTAVALGYDVTDSQYAAMAAASERGALYAVVSAFADGPLLTVVLSGCLLIGFRRTGSARVDYGRLLAVVAHAGVVLTLRAIVAAPLAYARETLASPLTLRFAVSGLDEASLAARVAGAVDLFVVWWILVLAIGASAVSGRPARRLAAIGLGAYLAAAGVVGIATTLLSGAP